MGVRRQQVTKRGPLRKPRAATEDILPKVSAEERVPAKWQRYYQRLIDLRQSLHRSQENLNREALEEQPGFSMHMADAGTDAYDRDFALGMLSTELDAIYEIEHALGRIRNGAYGICELTGKRIEKERLDAIPWTRFSLAAEKKLEREGRVKRAGLGPRETVAKTQAWTTAEDEE